MVYAAYSCEENPINPIDESPWYIYPIEVISVRIHVYPSIFPNEKERDSIALKQCGWRKVGNKTAPLEERVSRCRGSYRICIGLLGGISPIWENRPAGQLLLVNYACMGNDLAATHPVRVHCGRCLVDSSARCVSATRLARQVWRSRWKDFKESSISAAIDAISY